MRRPEITTFFRSSISRTGAKAGDRPRPSQKPNGSAPRRDRAPMAQEQRESDRDQPPLAPVISLWAFKERQRNAHPREDRLGRGDEPPDDRPAA